MKPVSMASSPFEARSARTSVQGSRARLSTTVWVSAWPPSRSSTSKRVTWAVREATYAAVSPATPAPTTATRSGTPITTWSRIERNDRDHVVAGLGRLRVGLLDGDPGAVRRGRVAAEDDLVVRTGGHHPGGDHHLAVLQPEVVVVARRRSRHALGDDGGLVELLRAVDRGAAAVADGHRVVLDVAGGLD